LFKQLAMMPRYFAAVKTGNSMAAKIAMIAMTTRSSISVNPDLRSSMANLPVCLSRRWIVGRRGAESAWAEASNNNLLRQLKDTVFHTAFGHVEDRPLLASKVALCLFAKVCRDAISISSNCPPTMEYISVFAACQ
jgi:hypothetical protein